MSEVPEVELENKQINDPDQPLPDQSDVPTETGVDLTGTYAPMKDVELAIPVIEEGKFENYDAVMLSNHDSKELESARETFMKYLLSQQKDRRRQAEEGTAQYRVASLDSGPIYLTESELMALGTMGVYEKTLRQGAGVGIFECGDSWTNLPKFGEIPIVPGKVDHTTSKDPVTRIRGRLGLSTKLNVPLWGSGLHLQLEGPGLLDQLRLDISMLLEKVESSRASNGFALSAPAVFLNRHVIDFILSYVSSSTLGTVDIQTLKRTILLTDLEPLALYGAASIYPDGYNLERPCLEEFGGCGHVVTRKVNLRRMLFVRQSKFSPTQLEFMAKRSGQIDPSLMRNYQESSRPDVSRYIDLDGTGLMLKLKVPTIAEYERVAGAWMTRMETRARSLLTSDASEQDREAYLAKANSMALIMLFGHWIEAVVEREGDLDTQPVVLLSRPSPDAPPTQETAAMDEKVDKILEDLSGDLKMVEKIGSGIEKFMNDMTLSTVAVPKTICPNCKKPLTGDQNSQHPHLVSINPIELFFTLLRHRIQLV